MKTENDNKNLNVPNLRFPEFDGEYLDTTLSELASIVGGGTPDTTVPKYWNGEIQWFTPSEIGKHKYVLHSERTISKDGLNNSSAKLLPKNTILLSTRATIGEASIAKAECCTNQGFQSLIANSKRSDNEYLYYLVATLKKELIRRSCGSTFLEISANEVRRIKAKIPSLLEQQKISSFLSLLDKRIDTQIKIIEDLKKLKSAIRSKLYLQIENTCESNIEIRDMLNYEQPSEYIVKSTEYSDQYKTPVLTANKAFILGYTDEEFGVYDKGECIILDDFTMDVKYVSFPFKVKSSAIKILTPKTDVDLYFIYEYIQYLGLVADEHKRHYISEIEPISIAYISFNEQCKISNTLRSIDKQIENANSILFLCNKQKQYLLSQMFI